MDPLAIPSPRRLPLEPSSIRDNFVHRMTYSVAKDRYTASDYDIYDALAFAVRDRLVERWFKTQNDYYFADVKRVYYLSLEFLMCRALLNNILNLGAPPAYRDSVASLGFDLNSIQEQE